MNATGHMLVARIAWDKMTPAARAAVADLASDPNNHRLASIVNSIFRQAA